MAGKHVIGSNTNSLAQTKLDLRIEGIAEKVADAAFDQHHDHLSQLEQRQWQARYAVAKEAARLALAVCSRCKGSGISGQFNSPCTECGGKRD